MQGNNNFVRIFKQKDKDVRLDPKRDKNRPKAQRRINRKLRLGEILKEE